MTPSGLVGLEVVATTPFPCCQRTSHGVPVSLNLPDRCCKREISGTSDAGLPRRSSTATFLLALAAVVVLVAVMVLNGRGAEPTVSSAVPDARTPRSTSRTTAAAPENVAAPAIVTLAVAGDVHFENELAQRPADPDVTLGRLSKPLRDADLAMVILGSALTSRGAPTPKELEDPSQRYWFRSPPSALSLLARSGVDAVSIANNHGADYGVVGLRDTLRADAGSPIAVLSVGDGRAEALQPHRVTVRGVEVAILAADASARERRRDLVRGEVRSGHRGGAQSAAVLRAVRGADRTDDVVVVYLH